MTRMTGPPQSRRRQQLPQLPDRSFGPLGLDTATSESRYEAEGTTWQAFPHEHFHSPGGDLPGLGRFISIMFSRWRQAHRSDS